MNRAVLLSGLAALALTSLSVGAIAQQSDMRLANPGAHPEFSTIDANGDGQISQDELDLIATQRFAAIDTDGNGTVSTEEMVAHMKAMEEQRRADRETRMAEKMIARMDLNDDGVLSADEMKPGAVRPPKTMLERLDTDGNGTISQEEFAAAEKRMDEMRERSGKWGGRGERDGDREGRHMRDHDGDREGRHMRDHMRDHDRDGDHRPRFLEKGPADKAPADMAPADKAPADKDRG
ncbi:EF-hand domain-containing protein [Pseudooceanicola spongiae]|uniref:EF-hand domain-containing protein n=1 Tax=Pseudooceanicola spongiae TaxID=2613965 RepID=A0A7L9WM48_9RHOB|nr:EF-hand domain-containing protein [Pseudooceanicola spongiae]QOL80797.1 hypothetical protein F3W81_08200 [Pseudooceanicola spongiae]